MELHCNRASCFPTAFFSELLDHASRVGFKDFDCALYMFRLLQTLCEDAFDGTSAECIRACAAWPLHSGVLILDHCTRFSRQQLMSRPGCVLLH
jgi:hypothetical protein